MLATSPEAGDQPVAALDRVPRRPGLSILYAIRGRSCLLLLDVRRPAGGSRNLLSSGI
jgi:hypothetical protein